MTAIDWGILLVAAISVTIGLWRGFVREAIALAGWVSAVMASAIFGASVAGALPISWSEPLRIVVAYTSVFMLVLVVAAMIGWLLSRLVRAVGLGLVDRAFGAVFGLARGTLIVLLLVAAASLSSLPRSVMWRESIFLPVVLAGIQLIRPLLPLRTESTLQALLGAAGDGAEMAMGRRS